MRFAHFAKALSIAVVAIGLFLQSNSFKSKVEAAQSFESAQVKIIRCRDGRVVSSPNAVYPNDRVARGECYEVQVIYRTDAVRPPGTITIPEYYDAKVVTRVNGVIKETRQFRATSFETIYSWKDKVLTSPSFSNVYFDVYSKPDPTTGVERLLVSQRLPIGSY